MKVYLSKNAGNICMILLSIFWAVKLINLISNIYEKHFIRNAKKYRDLVNDESSQISVFKRKFYEKMLDNLDLEEEDEPVMNKIGF